jgi:hypothetical protein
MSTDVFEIRLGQNVNMYTHRVFINKRVCQYVNTTDLIVIEHYIAIQKYRGSYD